MNRACECNRKHDIFIGDGVVDGCHNVEDPSEVLPFSNRIDDDIVDYRHVILGRVIEASPRQNSIPFIFYPMQWSMIVFGLWPLGLSKVSAIIYKAWSFLFALSFIMTLAAEVYWWVGGWITCTGGDSPEARIAEIAYLLKMAISWWTTRQLMLARGRVIRTILTDRRFLKSSRSYIRCTGVAVIAYAVVTTWLYAQIALIKKDIAVPFSIPFLILSWLYTFPYLASVCVYAVACLHVRDQVLYFARNSDITRIRDLRVHFEWICCKLEQLGGFFGAYLTVCHVCGMAKLAAVLFLWDFSASPAAWMYLLLAARVIGMLVIADIIGAQVSTSTRLIQQRIVEWHHYALSPKLASKDRQEQLLLCQHSAMLETRNYHSLQIFTLDLTPQNLLRFAYLLGALVFYSVNYLAHRCPPTSVA